MKPKFPNKIEVETSKTIYMYRKLEMNMPQNSADMQHVSAQIHTSTNFVTGYLKLENCASTRIWWKISFAQGNMTCKGIQIPIANV
jgi:hypothetical protein